MNVPSRNWILGLVALALLATVGALLILTPQLVQAETRDVGVGESIQAAIDAASPGETIRVAEGTFNVSLEIAKSLVLEGGYTDFGTGARNPRNTILQGTSRVIEISGVGVDVTVDGFEITGGAASDGGGIWADAEQGCRVVIHDNYIHHNTAGDSGGGLWADLNDRCELEITDNRIYSNTAGSTGGGLWAYLGMSGTLTLENNEVYTNTAGSERGGFHAWVEHYGRFSVDGNEIRGNHAAGEQGGFSFEATSNSSGTFDDNEVVGNVADYYDGGGLVILRHNASSTFRDNLFAGNEAEDDDVGGMNLQIEYGSSLVGEGLQIVGNTAGSAYGGAYVYVQRESSAILPGTIVSGNVADSGDVGGASFEATDGCRIEVPDLYVYDNRAAGGDRGGVELVTKQRSTIVATSAQIISNTANDVGGGAYANLINVSLIDLTGSTFEGNRSEGSGGGLKVDDIDSGSTLVLNHTHFLTNTAGGSGGGYYSSMDLDYGGRLELSHAEFRGNHAANNGGAIDAEGPEASSAFINYNTFVGNTAGSHGGAIQIGRFAEDGSFTSFVGNTLTGNVAGSRGGAIYNEQYMTQEGGHVLFNNNRIEDNQAGGEGGGAYLQKIERGRVEMVGNTVSGNTAGNEGGGLWIWYLRYGSILTMTGNVMNDNVAGLDGGGLYLHEYIHEGSVLYFEDNELLRNHSGEDGGGCSIDEVREGAVIAFAGNKVNHNTAAGEGGGCHFDDGIVWGSTVDMRDNEFNYNRAGSHYGGLFVEEVETGSTLRFWSNQVISNTAGLSGTQVTGGDVGGLAIGVVGNTSYGLETSGLADLRENLILSNTAYMTGTTGGRAGALYAFGKTGGWLAMQENTIRGNVAGDRYGALWVGLGGEARLDMEHNQVAANRATTMAGGLYLYGESGPNHYFLRRNRFIDNEAAGAAYPGGLLIEDVDGDDLWGLSENNLIAGNTGFGITLIDADWQGPNDTIADNTGHAFAFSGTVPSTITLINDIVWGNGGLLLQPGTVATGVIEYSDVEIPGPNPPPGPGNMNVDPKFVGGGDYHLQAGSPVSNTADTARAPAVDLDGVARPQGAAADMGCYEYVGAAVQGAGPDMTPVWAQASILEVDEGASIQDAIDGASSGDTIRVAAGTFTESLEITKSLALVGGYKAGFTEREPRSTILKGASRVIQISGVGLSVTVDGFEITGGTETDGAGIWADAEQGCRVVVHDNYIHDNVASGDGGGLWADLSDRCDLEITGNRIYSNTAGSSGGGFYANLYMSGTLTVDDNEIISNTATSNGGGFVGDVQRFIRFSVGGNEIRDNTANADYAGLDFYASSHSSGTMGDNEITDNTASNAGGGGSVRFWHNSSSAFYSNLFQDNEAIIGDFGGLELQLRHGSRLIGEELRIIGNTAGDENGGAGMDLYEGASAILPGTIISGNVAKGNDTGGGEFRLDKGCRLEVPELYVYDNRATAGVYGGVDLWVQKGGTISATDSQVISNTAQGAGGGGSADVDDVSLVDLTGATFERNRSESSGGGLWVADIDSGSILRLDYTHFLTNTAGGSGGGYYGNSDLDYGGRLDLSHAEFRGNQADNNGGAIATQGPETSRAFMNHNIFVGNTAENHGGAIYIGDFADQGGFASFVGNTLTGNVAGSRGGAIYNEYYMVNWGGRVLFDDNWIDDNRASSEGGGVWFDAFEEGRAEMSGNTIINNTAGDHGGGLFIFGLVRGATVTMTGNVINDNVAGWDGGGLVVTGTIRYGPMLAFQDNELQRNHSDEDGGGCFIKLLDDGSAIHMAGNWVNYNTATGEGGGCYVGDGLEGGSTVDLQGNEFNDNTAGSDYGGLFVKDVKEGSTLRLWNNEIISNRAGISGTQVTGGDVGGLAIGVVGSSIYGLMDGGLADLQHNQILSNTASLDGATGGRVGALYGYGQTGGWLKIQENTLQGNVAGDSYGAQWVSLGGRGRLDMEQNLVAANQAGDDTGGLYLQGIDGPNHYFLLRNRFVDNESSGVDAAGGLRLEDGDGDDLWGVSTNNLIAGNTGDGIWLVNADWYGPNDTIAGNSGHAFASSGAVASTIELLNDIVWGNTGGLHQELSIAGSIVAEYSDVQGGLLPGAGNLSEDPLFVGGGDYHLQGVSPAIDRADAARAPAVDLEGDPRPQGAGVDMGCYERTKAGVSLEPDQAASQAPGTEVVYAFTLANGSLVSDQFQTTVLTNPLGWLATVLQPEVNLAPGTTTTVQVRLTVPARTAAGTLNAMLVQAQSTSDSSVVDDAKLDITSGLAAQVSLEPDQAGSGEAGTTVVYSHTLKNLGNGDVSFDLATTSSQNWTATVSPTAVTVAAGKAVSVTVRVAIPAGAAVGTVDLTTVTATSQSDAGVSDSAVDTTTVGVPAQPTVYLPLVLRAYP
jgi:hypothetical protein